MMVLPVNGALEAGRLNRRPAWGMVGFGAARYCRGQIEITGLSPCRPRTQV